MVQLGRHVRWFRNELFLLCRFSAVGATGFTVDAALLWLLVHLAELGPLIARGVSFPAALITTWFLNWAWAFVGHGTPFWRGLIKYVSVQLTGLSGNLAVYSLCVSIGTTQLSDPIAALALASVAGLLLNYLGLRFVVFQEASPPTSS